MSGGYAIFGKPQTEDEIKDEIKASVAIGGEQAMLEEATEFGIVKMQLAVWEDEKPFTKETLLYKEWDGKYTEHRWPVPYENLSITHVVMLEGPSREGVERPLYFNGKRITGQFSLTTYDEKTDTYKPIHCIDCAYVILEWITNAQGEWRRPKEATHGAPARLQ